MKPGRYIPSEWGEIVRGDHARLLVLGEPPDDNGRRPALLSFHYFPPLRIETQRFWTLVTDAGDSALWVAATEQETNQGGEP